jgi:DNA-directed RNA polymerase specialized sigma24 family protein
VSFWVNSIARNLFRARFRSPQTSTLDAATASYQLDVEAIELNRMLERCSKRDRTLLERSLAGYSAEEIARKEGITSTGIRVRLLRVRQHLREQIRGGAGLAPAPGF